MAGWITWLVVAAILAGGEITLGSGSFFLAPFAMGAALAGAADAGIDGIAAWVVFVVASIATLLAVRPLLQRRLFRSPMLRTGAAALIGKHAVVVERISNEDGVGKVRIDNDVWTARCLADGHVIAEGESVEVIEIRGATALVMD